MPDGKTITTSRELMAPEAHGTVIGPARNQEFGTQAGDTSFMLISDGEILSNSLTQQAAAR